MISTFKISRPIRKRKREEFLKFNDDRGRETFFNITNNNNRFTKCFENNNDFEKQGQLFFKSIRETVNESFKKVRINNKKLKEYGDKEFNLLCEQRTSLSQYINKNNCQLGKVIAKATLTSVEKKMVEKTSERNAQKIRKLIGETKTLDGTFNQVNFWKLKKKMMPQSMDIPIAKRDSKGNLVTSEIPLKKLYKETYKERLSPGRIKSGLEDILALKSQLWLRRNEEMRKQKSNPWTMIDLERSLKCLKPNKARDPHGLVNELFMEGRIGKNLKEALLMFFNEIKAKQKIPNFMNHANIISIFKQKSSKEDMSNQRGIFGITIMKTVLDYLIYNEYYDAIDNTMSDSNARGRKKRMARIIYLLYME